MALVALPRTAGDAEQVWSAEAAGFRSGGDFTVGVEEELLLVDEHDQLLAADDALVAGLGAHLSSDGVVAPELFAAEIEFSTHVCTAAEDVAERLGRFRLGLQRAGSHPMAVGLHPSAPFGAAALTPSPRYDSIAASLGGLLRTPTAAVQVHVGMPDGSAAVAAFRGLRNRISVLRALAAGSPFWHGRDSGLASSRWAVLRSYPRSGLPPAVASWDEYEALVRGVVAAAEVPDSTHVWWDLRLRPQLGTIEVRAMDAQPSLEAVAGLTALIQGVARHAVEGPEEDDLPSPVLAENDFQAARHGLDGRIVDPGGQLRPIRAVANDLLRDARAVLAADRLDVALGGIEQILTDEPAYQRQRRIHAETGMAAVLADLSRRSRTGSR